MKKIIIMVAFIFIIPFLVKADDFYLYWEFNPNHGYITGIGSYIDTQGILGEPGAQYIIFTGGPSYTGNHTAYIYRVEVDGDPYRHPNNPDDPGPVAPRIFTLVSTYNMGYYCCGHENAFWVDDSGIYYGASAGWGGVYHWDFGWTNKTRIIPQTNLTTQTLAYDVRNGQWWIGTGDRRLYRYRNNSWQYVFTHPNLGGGHHDGMEIVNGILYISDMTTQHLIAYHLDDYGNLVEPPNQPFAHYYYTSGRNVEGMTYGPNDHFWISTWNGHSVIEIGGGSLVVPTVTPTPTPAPIPTTNRIGNLILIIFFSIVILLFIVIKISSK